jgi:CheY-like chemotaxis protein
LDAVAQALGVNGMQPKAAAEPADEPPAAAPVRPLRILLAEDNQVNQRLAVGLLEKYGHHVVVAEDGDDAVRFYRDGEFDLILMDVQMPRCDGLEATRRIRELESGTAAHVPIVAMTAHALVGDRDRCLAAGMDDFISKPIRIAQVLKAIGEATGTVAGIPSVVRERKPAEAHQSVDWTAALDTVGGDQDLLRDLTQVFVAEAKSMLDDVLNARDSGEGKDLRRAAHSLKGALRHLGATQAAAVAQELERAGETEDFSGVPVHCERLKAEVALVVAEFRRFIAT